MTDETPAHGCTINGQPAIPILISEYQQLTAEQDRLTAELADYEQRVQHLDAALARVQALADEHPAGIDTALIHEALDWTQAPVNPPGSTREQLPDHVLALLPIHPYLSTACQTADAVACTAVRGLPLYDELRTHAERLHGRCRLNHKFTGQPCTCGCHPTPAPAATPAADKPA